MAFATINYADADGQHSVPLDRASMSLGRLPDQDIVVREQCVSRRHAAIMLEGTVYSIVDLKSTHGTYVNGKRIERSALNADDQIQLGSVDALPLHFHIEAPGGPGTQTTITTLLSSLVQFPVADQKALPAAREMEQLNWLLSAARQLNAGGAIEEILTTLLQLTLQLTGVERGFVFLRDGGEMKLAQGLNVSGEIIREEKTISRRAIQKAIESDRKFSISDTFSDEAASAWASVMVNKIRSIYCIPLRKRDGKGRNSELLGLLYLDSQLGAGNLSEVDHQLLDTIANEAAALLQNALLAEAENRARRAREELAVAARIHSGLMAITMPVIPYAVLKARSVPCYEIGGDFFDALLLPDCVCIAIADVSGKGIPAAIVAATIQGIIHSQLLSGQGLEEVASLLNQFLCTRNVGKYATMVLLKLYPDGRVEYLNCGHIQPLLIDESGMQWLPESNLIVGLLPGATYSSGHISMCPGARILLVTDGLVEAENPAGEALGDTGLTEVVPNLDVDGILAHVAQFQAPNEAQDDCTLVEVRFTGLA